MKSFSLFILFFSFSSFYFAQNKEKTLLFVGSYTDGIPGKGIAIFDFNTHNGKLELKHTIDSIVNPSYITVSADGKFLNACTETKLESNGNIASYQINSKTNDLHFLNKQDAGGLNPVYVVVNKENTLLVNANYTSGNVTAFHILPDGMLEPYHQRFEFSGSGKIAKRQEQSHIHAAVFSPDESYIYITDLGADQIRIFKLDSLKSHLEICPNDFQVVCAPGSGPRHFAFHPKLDYAYCIEELSGTVCVYRVEEHKLDSIQRVFSYSKNQETYNSADIHISSDGLFLYASNRWENENTISIFSIDQKTGMLQLIGHQKTMGDHPRNFTFDPTENYLLVANQLSNNIVVFKRNKKTGLLRKTRRGVTFHAPSCLVMKMYTE